jgi:hypothetical protein
MKSNNPTVFFGSIVVAVVALLLAIYYAIPGVYHVLTSGSHPAMQPQPTHILLFAVITILAIIAALVTRPKAAKAN